jgi:hypothetical protein
MLNMTPAQRSAASVLGRTHTLLGNCRVRARRNRVAMTLTKDWLFPRVERGVCELSGINFVMLPKGRHPRAPSVDRIRPGEGYTPDNCRVVCAALNAALSNYGFAEVSWLWAQTLARIDPLTM